MLKHLLLVDDSVTIQKAIKIAFSSTNFTISSAASLADALVQCKGQRPGVILADAHLEDAKGPLDYSKLVHESGGVPMILLFGSHETINREAFETAGFQNFMKKPFESDQIVQAVFQVMGETSPLVDSDGANLPPPPDVVSKDLPPTPPPPVEIPLSNLRPLQDKPPAISAVESLREKGKPAFAGFDPPPAFQPASTSSHGEPLKSVPPSFNEKINTDQNVADQSRSSHGEQKQVSKKSNTIEMDEDLLRKLIRSEIESTFREQIASIAKTVITAELRRLADEKTRHLNDD